MRKVLIIAHYFPPIGGAGVQRTSKFVKYLPEFGWSPIVVTGSKVPDGPWTPKDQSLAHDVGNEVTVVRVDWSSDLENSSKNDQRVIAFQKAADEAISRYQPELIMVTMSPFQDAPIGAKLSEKHGIPWVADLRDPWALDEFQMYRTFWHRIQDRKKMRSTLSSASLVIMNTPVAARRLEENFPEFAGRVSCVTNGFDRDDFPEPLPFLKSQHFTIVHSGHFHVGAGLRQQRQALLNRLFGRIQNGVEALSRSHYYLNKALMILKDEEPELFPLLRVKCLGVSHAADQKIVEEAGFQDVFQFTGYLPHEECVEEVRRADLLFLPMHSIPQTMEASIVPGKTYEYMAAGRPILAAIPEGDAAQFLRESQSANFCGPKDVRKMADILKENLTAWNEGEGSCVTKQEFVARFERRELTKHLAEHLGKVADEH